MSFWISIFLTTPMLQEGLVDLGRESEMPLLLIFKKLVCWMTICTSCTNEPRWPLLVFVTAALHSWKKKVYNLLSKIQRTISHDFFIA